VRRFDFAFGFDRGRAGGWRSFSNSRAVLRASFSNMGTGSK
jgi:hypothetical protein